MVSDESFPFHLEEHATSINTITVPLLSIETLQSPLTVENGLLP